MVDPDKTPRDKRTKGIRKPNGRAKKVERGAFPPAKRYVAMALVRAGFSENQITQTLDVPQYQVNRWKAMAEQSEPWMAYVQDEVASMFTRHTEALTGDLYAIIKLRLQCLTDPKLAKFMPELAKLQVDKLTLAAGQMLTQYQLVSGKPTGRIQLTADEETERRIEQLCEQARDIQGREISRLEAAKILAAIPLGAIRPDVRMKAMGMLTEGDDAIEIEAVEVQ